MNAGKDQGRQDGVRTDSATSKRTDKTEGRQDETKLDSAPNDKIVRQPSQVPLPKRELRSRYFQQKRPRQSPSPELTSKRACGDMLVTETPLRPVTERQTKHWEALKDLKSPDQTTKPA